MTAAESGASESADEKMAKEREIKLKIEDLPALRRALKKLGAHVAKPRVHERNVLFDTPEFTLAKGEQLLRIRTETPATGLRKSRPHEIVTFKGPNPAATSGKSERHKVREEIELEISDAKALAKIFERLGMRESFRYEKFRTTYRLPASRGWARRLLIEIDETPIGIFLELEGPAKAIDRAAQALGFEKKEYILANYMVLYREYCLRRGEEPGDMLFARKKSGDKSEKIKFFS